MFIGYQYCDIIPKTALYCVVQPVSSSLVSLSVFVKSKLEKKCWFFLVTFSLFALNYFDHSVDASHQSCLLIFKNFKLLVYKWYGLSVCCFTTSFFCSWKCTLSNLVYVANKDWFFFLQEQDICCFVFLIFLSPRIDFSLSAWWLWKLALDHYSTTYVRQMLSVWALVSLVSYVPLQRVESFGAWKKFVISTKCACSRKDNFFF